MNDEQGRSLRPTEDRLQSRVTVAAFLMGLGIALWALPVICLAFDMPRGVFGISTNLVSSVSILVFGLGIFYGYQKQTNDWLGRSETEAAREREALRGDVAELRELLLTLSASMTEHIERTSIANMQEYFNAEGNASVNLLGGAKLADEQVTRRLPDANIIPMPQHQARPGNQRPQGRAEMNGHHRGSL